MVCRHISILCLVFLYSSLTLASQSIVDEGKYFTAATIDSAQKQINELSRTLHINIRVDTYEKIEMESSPQANEQHFFDKRVHDWVEQQNKKSGPNGIHLLFIRDPGYVIIAVGKALQECKEISEDQRLDLTKTIQSEFEIGRFDEGLLAGLNYLSQTLHRDHSGKNAISRADKILNNETLVSPKIMKFASEWLLTIGCSIWALILFFKIRRELRLPSSVV